MYAWLGFPRTQTRACAFRSPANWPLYNKLMAPYPGLSEMMRECVAGPYRNFMKNKVRDLLTTTGFHVALRRAMAKAKRPLPPAPCDYEHKLKVLQFMRPLINF